MASSRIKKLVKLIAVANDLPTDWLVANVRDYHPERDVSRLSLIACLRVIAARTETSGRPYRERMRSVKARLFA